MQAEPDFCVLIVDDDADTRSNLCDILELDRYRVETAGTAAEVLRRKDWSRISAILLDRRLPDGNAEDQASREDDFDRGVGDDANRRKRVRGSRKGVCRREWLPVSEFSPTGIESGLTQATGVTESADGLTGSLPGGDRVPPELLPVGVAAMGLGHVGGLLVVEKASSIPDSARRPWTGFQLPTTGSFNSKPRHRSASRVRPRQTTKLPGGGSFVRPKCPPSLATSPR